MWRMPISSVYPTFVLSIANSIFVKMIPYEQQLTFKKRVIQKAYATYSGLGLDQVPEVLPTIPSPKQYGYRTKITPHFNAPPKGKKVVDGSGSVQKEWELRIGFDQKGRRAVMDIEVSSF